MALPVNERVASLDTRRPRRAPTTSGAFISRVTERDVLCLAIFYVPAGPEPLAT